MSIKIRCPFCSWVWEVQYEKDSLYVSCPYCYRLCNREGADVE